ncbi:MAG: prepilin-type N-terminal cleavage/methylation domain-containing protein [Nitrospiraceae bacterium]|nr:prepilin-type N-terminal cleavage/methylation domain-containing protein [Nitrospiraceae bacterium]
MTFNSGSKQSREAGFTLIESVMVIVLIAILSAVVFLRNPFDAIKLNSAVRKVFSDIRYTQKLAISNQTRAGITFNGNGYTVYSNIVTSTIAKSSGDPCSNDGAGSFVVNFNSSQCSNYSSVTLTPSVPTIAFDSLGKPVDATGNPLASQTVIVNYSGNKTINIEANTGRVYEN